MTLQVSTGGTWNSGSRSLTGGTDISQYVQFSSLRITNSIRDGASTLSFVARMPQGISGTPAEGALVQIVQDGSVIHAGPMRRVTQGLVQNASTKWSKGAIFDWEVECSDWTTWLDHRPVYGTYPHGAGSGVTDYAGNIIRAIIDDPSPYSSLICSKTIINGITGNSKVPYDFGHTASGGGDTIANGIIIPVQNIIFQDFTQVIGEIARQTGFLWHVSSDRIIHFYDRVAGSHSPLLAANGAAADNTLDLDVDVANYDSFTWTKDVSQLITRVILLNASLKQPGNMGLQSYTNVPAGQSWFNLGFVPSIDPADWDLKVWNPGANPLTDPPAREYNAANNNVKIESVDGHFNDPKPWPDVCFVCQTNNGVRIGGADIPAGSTVNANFRFFTQTMLDRWLWSNPTSGVAIDFTFPGSGQPASISALHGGSPSAQDDIGAREGSDGIYTRVISDSTLLMSSTDIGNEKADQWLRRFGINLHLARFNSFTQGWRAGQSFTVQSSAWGISAETLYVQQVSMTPFWNDKLGTMQLRSTVECSNNPWGA